MNIVEIATGSQDFNILVQALTAANLVTTIQNANDITVFAPNDAAFTKLAVELGFTGDQADGFIMLDDNTIDTIRFFEAGVDKIDVSAFAASFDELDLSNRLDGRGETGGSTSMMIRVKRKSWCA